MLGIKYKYNSYVVRDWGRGRGVFMVVGPGDF